MEGDGGDANEDSQGHAAGKLPGVFPEAEDFQPLVAEEGL